MFARFDENPAMTLEDIKETKRYGRTDGRTHEVKTVYPPQTKFWGYKEPSLSHRDGSFEYPHHMFWLRNKKSNICLHTLIWGLFM